MILNVYGSKMLVGVLKQLTKVNLQKNCLYIKVDYINYRIIICGGDYSTEVNKLYNEDCLELMRDIPDKSIDAIITDLPYG